jgi:hypothetical protein
MKQEQEMKNKIYHFHVAQYGGIASVYALCTNQTKNKVFAVSVDVWGERHSALILYYLMARTTGVRRLNPDPENTVHCHAAGISGISTEISLFSLLASDVSRCRRLHICVFILEAQCIFETQLRCSGGE